MASIYRSLAGHETRRLTLHPGSEHQAPLICTLSVLSLHDSLEYEALSYVWGLETASEQLLLNESPMSVTANLDVALRHLRRPTEPRILWVDALCINQQDLDERAAQVRLMQDIYKKATSVLVWLGAAADSSDAAMASIDCFNKEYWQTYDFQVQFMRILYRPWFTRIWTVQEFVLGTEPNFGCGDVWVPWLSFIVAWAHFRDKYEVLEARYNQRYKENLLETFGQDWMDAQAEEEKDMAKAREWHLQLAPVTLDSAAVWGKLSKTLDADTLQQLTLNTREAVQSSTKRAPRTWRAWYKVMQLCKTKSLEAIVVSDYWRLNNLVPLDYYGFLMNARGVIQR